MSQGPRCPQSGEGKGREREDYAGKKTKPHPRQKVNGGGQLGGSTVALKTVVGNTRFSKGMQDTQQSLPRIQGVFMLIREGGTYQCPVLHGVPSNQLAEREVSPLQVG